MKACHRSLQGVGFPTESAIARPERQVTVHSRAAKRRTQRLSSTSPGGNASANTNIAKSPYIHQPHRVDHLEHTATSVAIHPGL